MQQYSSFSQRAIELASCNLHAWVNPQNGMNVERIVYKGVDVIFCDLQRREKGATYAVPILFPTPNRVENNQFTFNGKTYYAKMHGIAHFSTFRILQNIQTSQEHLLSGVLNVDVNSLAYKWYAFQCQIFIRIRVLLNKIIWEYTVKNTGSSPCPYSFGLHPFFKKYKGVTYQVFAKNMMENTTEKIPTGKLLQLNTQFDVRLPTNPDDNAFDNVFCVQNNPMARFYYPSEKISVTIRASKQFKRCVVYTPSHAEFFCIEPQTSSINCHNLHNDGYVTEANLRIVPAHCSQSGWISFDFSDDNA